MQIPAQPVDEDERIAALRGLNILDTDPEQRFDMLTDYACSLFGVPIALVTLVDADRQWFKSHQGLRTRETGRDIGFCAHTILRDNVFVVPDARADARFADNPLVREAPHIRFYAGCPLKMADGHNVGTLCLIDRRPRSLDNWELQHLKDLALIAAQELQGIDASSEWHQACIA